MNWNIILGFIALLTSSILTLAAVTPDLKLVSRQSQPKYVFAHFMVRIKASPHGRENAGFQLGKILTWCAMTVGWYRAELPDR
jgi:hypothetical protein